MESGRPHRPSKSTRGVEQKNDATDRSTFADDVLPNIVQFIDYGEITIGVLDPVGGVPVASDDSNTLAMLVRRKGETLSELLIRLDQAIAKANTEDIFTDEINPPPTLPRLR